MENAPSIDSIMQMLQLTAMTSKEHSEQMGLIFQKQKQTDEKIDALTAEVRENTRCFNERMQCYEDRIRLTRPQATNIKQSIHQRVLDLLDIRYEDGIVADECIFDDKFYRPRFVSRLYADARRDSRLGTPYYETYQRDYSEVLDFIAHWEPPTGTAGYKRYLDNRRREQ